MTDDRFDLLVSVQEYAEEHLRTAARYAGSGPRLGQRTLLPLKSGPGQILNWGSRSPASAISSDMSKLGN